MFAKVSWEHNLNGLSYFYVIYKLRGPAGFLLDLFFKAICVLISDALTLKPRKSDSDPPLW